MKGTKFLSTIVTLLILLLVSLGPGAAQGPDSTSQAALGTAFSYQGYLSSGGEPIEGACDFQFSLYDDPISGALAAGPLEQAGVTVSGGRFTTLLDFGAVFEGTAYWLQVEVQCPGDTAYTTLPRQPLTAAPYALYSQAAPWDGIADMPAGFADGVDDVDDADADPANELEMPPDCASGQLAKWDGSAWVCAVDEVDDADADPGNELEMPISCANGQIAEWDGSGWACGADDDTTYDAGFGLELTGNSFSVFTSTVQQRVNWFCVVGYSIRAINADGTVVCEPDDVDDADADPANELELPISCANGQIAEWDGSAWVCAEDDVEDADADPTNELNVSLVLSGTALLISDAGGTLIADLGSIDTLSGLSCAGGEIAQWDGSTWVCADDADTTYSAGFGLQLAGTTFNVLTTTVQRRVTGACAVDSTVRAINANGSVVCELDDDTTYTAGTGLALAGTELSITPTYRLPQTCANGQIPEWNGASWSCGDDDDTTYTVGTGLLLTGTQLAVDFSKVAFFTHSHSLTSTDRLKYFQEEFTLATSGAYDWEFFTISNTYYLAVANQFNGSSYNIDSMIYRWDGAGFAPYQAIPTSGAQDWEFFTIGSESYLAVAQYTNGATYNIDSMIYRWDGGYFIPYQGIPTSGASDWEFFTIGGESYLAVAQFTNGTTYELDSMIYHWDGTYFNPYQGILAGGASDWEFFTIGSESYLAIANYRNNSTYSIDSKIYHWSGIFFDELQSIPTKGAWDWEFFSIGGESYLAVANSHDDSGDGPNTDSKIYQWNGANFVEFQSIPTSRAQDWAFFTSGSDAYLAIANKYNGSYNIDSRLYRWQGTGFAETQPVPTNGAQDWAFFTIGSDAYLAVANSYDQSTYNLDSKIYRAVLEERAGTSYLWGQNQADVYYNQGNVGIGTTAPQSALQVQGYVQLDTLTTAPPAADCDEASERGRMKVDVANNLLYICTNSGWVAK